MYVLYISSRFINLPHFKQDFNKRFFQVSFSTYRCFISNFFIKVFMSKILEISMDRSERTVKSKTTNRRAFCCKTKHIWLKK